MYTGKPTASWRTPSITWERGSAESARVATAASWPNRSVAQLASGVPSPAMRLCSAGPGAVARANHVPISTA